MFTIDISRYLIQNPTSNAYKIIHMSTRRNRFIFSFKMPRFVHRTKMLFMTKEHLIS